MKDESGRVWFDADVKPPEGQTVEVCAATKDGRGVFCKGRVEVTGRLIRRRVWVTDVEGAKVTYWRYE